MWFQWENEKRHYFIDGSLRLHALEGEPDDWSPRVPAAEETAQTLLALHFRELTGEDATVFARSGDYWGGADLLALDALGRVHLLELKRDGINRDVVEQLGSYAMSEMFADLDALLAYWRERHARLDFTPERAACLVAGAIAGVRTDNFGRLDSARWAPELDEDERNAIRTRKAPYDTGTVPYRIQAGALLAKAASERGIRAEDLPSWAELLDLAELLRRAVRPVERPSVRARRPSVLWLVGRSFADEVLDPAKSQVRLWRRAGVDARLLRYEVRLRRGVPGWYVRVHRERAPERADLTQRVLRDVRDIGPHGRPVELRLDFYDTRKPSAGGLAEGGGLAEKPTASLRDGEVTLKAWDVRSSSAGSDLPS